MRYYIRQMKKHVSGPFERADIRRWIRAGRIRDDMDFSEDGREWMLGIEMVDLFPPRARPRARQPRWTLRGRCA